MGDSEGERRPAGRPLARVGRVVLAVGVFVSTYLFVLWVPFSLLTALSPLRVDWRVRSLVSLACAIAAAVSAFRWSPQRASATDAPEADAGQYVVLGALAVGGIGFILGFFGPMLIDPGANQGPLLGLFFTGPLGVVVGGIGGYAVWARSHRRP